MRINIKYGPNLWKRPVLELVQFYGMGSNLWKDPVLEWVQFLLATNVIHPFFAATF